MNPTRDPQLIYPHLFKIPSFFQLPFNYICDNVFLLKHLVNCSPLVQKQILTARWQIT